MASNTEESAENTGKATVLLTHSSITGWPSLEDGIAAKGWTLADFAKKVKRSERSVMAWIYGQNKPNTLTLVEIGKLLDVDVAQLLTDCPLLVKQMPPTEGIEAASSAVDGT